MFKPTKTNNAVNRATLDVSVLVICPESLLCTLQQTNMATEHAPWSPWIDDVPIKLRDFQGNFPFPGLITGVFTNFQDHNAWQNSAEPKTCTTFIQEIKNWNTEELKTKPRPNCSDCLGSIASIPRRSSPNMDMRNGSPWLPQKLDRFTLRNKLQNKLCGFQMGLSYWSSTILSWFICYHMFMFAPQNQIFAIHVSWIFLASFLDILQFLVLTHSRIAVAGFFAYDRCSKPG